MTRCGGKIMSDREDRVRAFIKELAHFLVDDQMAKGIALAIPSGPISWAREWALLRQKAPIFGYPDQAAAEKALTDFLLPPPPERELNLEHLELTGRVMLNAWRANEKHLGVVQGAQVAASEAEKAFIAALEALS